MGACKIGYLKKSEIRITLIISSQLLRSRSYEPELTISEVKVPASCRPESDAADVFLKSSLTWSGIAYFSLPTFVTKPLNQFSLIHFDDCIGMIGMIVLVSLVWLYYALHLFALQRVDVKPNQLPTWTMIWNTISFTFFMHSASVKCILCLKMYYLSYKIQPQSFFSKGKKYLEWLFYYHFHSGIFKKRSKKLKCLAFSLFCGFHLDHWPIHDEGGKLQRKAISRCFCCYKKTKSFFFLFLSQFIPFLVVQIEIFSCILWCKWKTHPRPG